MMVYFHQDGMYVWHITATTNDKYHNNLVCNLPDGKGRQTCRRQAGRQAG
jgi:hypothetical protein